MRLEPCRLIRHQRIGRRVRLVEAVTGEFLHQVEDIAGNLFVDALLRGAGDENLPLLGHLLGLLLAHGAAQQVGAAQRVAGHILGDLHHLFLVDDDAVGGLENGLQHRMRVFGFLLAVLDVDVVVDHPRLQRAGPEQCHQGDDVLETVWTQPLDQVLHAPRFQLEHGGGLATLQQLVGGGIIQRNQGYVDRRLTAGLPLAVNSLQRPIDDGQCAQTEEVELDQADGLDIVLVELGDQIVAARLTVKRTKIGEISRGNHYAPGMLAGITGQALQRACQIDEGANLFIAFIEILEVLAVLQGLFEGDAQLKRNQLGDPVDKAIGVAQHAPDVPHHRLGGHAAVSDYLGYAVAPVGGGDVVDDLVAAIHAEVDIEVGHGHALGIEEALEQQLELDRIEIGDLQGIGHQRSGAGATPGADRDAMLLGPLDEVGDDQEVAGEIHLVDDPDFQFQPGAVSRGAFLE